MGELKPKLLKGFFDWNCWGENVGVIPGINVDKMINKSCGQTSASVRLHDEDRVYDVERVVLQTSCSRHCPTFPLESAEADWCSLEPAEQDLAMWGDGSVLSSINRLHSRCPPAQAGRSRTRSGHSREARWDSKLCCSAQTAAISRALSLQPSTHWTPPVSWQKITNLCEVRSGYLALENVCDGQPARIVRLNGRTILTGLANQTLQPPLVSVIKTCMY